VIRDAWERGNPQDHLKAAGVNALAKLGLSGFTPAMILKNAWAENSPNATFRALNP
jgi:hypothetical protein